MVPGWLFFCGWMPLLVCAFAFGGHHFRGKNRVLRVSFCLPTELTISPYVSQRVL